MDTRTRCMNLEIKLTKEKIKRPPCIAPSLCEFWDYSGGHCLEDCEVYRKWRKHGKD
jgi:hypothetical protein